MQALAPLVFAVTIATAGLAAAVTPVSAQSVAPQPVAAATR